MLINLGKLDEIWWIKFPPKHIIIITKKVFDTIEYAILFDKLEIIGIRGIALDLVISFLLERSFTVKVDGE